MRQRLAVGGLIGVLGAGLLAGCGSAKLTADTVCKDYLAQPSNVRHDAAVRISSEIAGVSDPGNPMWGLSLDGACGSSPAMTIGQYFRHK